VRRTRTARFNTVPLSAAADIAKAGMLRDDDPDFISASPGGTGGGHQRHHLRRPGGRTRSTLMGLDTV